MDPEHDRSDTYVRIVSEKNRGLLFEVNADPYNYIKIQGSCWGIISIVVNPDPVGPASLWVFRIRIHFS